jgi:DNA-binding CsgD family transcriptional regulator
MELVERDDEVRLLTGLYAECAAGRGRVVLVSGPVATGKTALMWSLAARVGAEGGRFLGAVASRAEQWLPLGVVDQVLRAAGALTPRVRRLLDVGVETVMAAQERESDAGEQPLAPTLYALSLAMLDLADQSPLVISIDDLQYIDIASLQCLSHLAHRVHSARMLVVLNECTSIQPAYPTLRADLVRQPHTRRVRLRTLSPAGTAALLRPRLDAPTATALAADVHAASGGNPLLVNALIEDLRNGPDGRLVPGEAFDQAVLECLYRGESSTLAYAQTLALLGQPVTAEVAGELAGLGAELAERAARCLHEIGLVDGGRVRHARAAAAILHSIDPDERVAMHDRAAQLLYRHRAPAAVIARHLLAGGANPPWATTLLHEASKQALTAGDTPAALTYLRAAQHAHPDHEDAVAIQSALARVEWRLDPATALRHLDTLAEAARAGRLGTSGASATVHYLLWHGQIDKAVDLLNHLYATPSAQGEPDNEANACLQAARIWLICFYPAHAHRIGRAATGADGDAPEGPAATAGTAHGPAATPAARGAGTPARSRDASIVLAAGQRGSIRPDAVASAERLLQHTRLDDPTIGAIIAALSTLIYADRLDAATTWCQSFLAEAGNHQAPTWRALLMTIRAEVELRRGNLPQAEKDAQTALNLISTDGWGIAIGFPIATLLLAATGAGRYDVAARYLAVRVPAGMFETLPGLHYLHARGAYYLATHNHRSALRDFHACRQLMTTRNIDIPGLVPWRTSSAHAYLCLGDQRQAVHLVHEQLQRLQPQHQRTRGITLRTLAAVSDVNKRPALLNEAVNALKQAGDRLELAHAFADLSRALYDLGEPNRARGMLRTAQHIARQCNALGLLRTLNPDGDTALPAPAAGAGPRVIPADDPIGVLVAAGATGDDAAAGCSSGDGSASRAAAATSTIELNITELSAAERRVAALAAQGHTNREIASKLYVTISTVEQHLTRVYRKLKVNRRSQLSPGLHLDIVDPH